MLGDRILGAVYPGSQLPQDFSIDTAHIYKGFLRSAANLKGIKESLKQKDLGAAGL